MIRMMSRLAAQLILAAFLAGCGSDKKNDAFAVPSQAVGVLKQLLMGGPDGPAPKAQLTAAQLASFNQPVLQVNPETFGGSDFLGRSKPRRDSHLGVVEVWNSSDDAQIFLRDGVVVGTRGVGGDIISADANITISALSDSSKRSGLKTYFISDGDVTTTEYKFRCTVDHIGIEDISIANQRFTTRRVREDCVGGPSGKAVLHNEYWVQHPSKLVRKSRQWMGPTVGYFEILLVKN